MEKEYSSDKIQALSAREHVRLRPLFYFEKCFKENSLDSLPFEVLCHAFDEYFDENCSEIKLTIWKDKFSIIYNAGMPLSVKYDKLTIAEIIMTKIGACSNLKKHLEVGQEFCSLGMATINFASEKCNLTTLWKNKKGIFKFKNGIINTKNIELFKSDDNWTEIFVKPSIKIFKEIKFKSVGVKANAKMISGRLEKLNLIVEDKIE